MRNHLLRNLDLGIRYDGRKLDEFRTVIVEKGLYHQAEGSAKVRIGKSEVIVGVKLETMEPYPDDPEKGSIMVGAEFLPLASPDFESGPPGIDSIELARVVDRGIRESGILDFKKLCITPGEKAWMVIIDIVPINADGNLYDAASLGAIAALQDAKLPAFDGTKIDYKTKTDKGLPLTGSPIEVTVYKIGKHLVLDPTREEEQYVDARFTVASLTDGTMCAFQKGGDEPFMKEEIIEATRLAVKKAQELRKLL